MGKKYDDIWTNMVASFIVLLVVSLITYDVFVGSPNRKRIKVIKDIGNQALVEKRNVSTEIDDNIVVAHFKSGEYKNISIVRYKDKEYMFQDLNKSKIAGKFVAKKGKEFLSGLKDGIFGKKDE